MKGIILSGGQGTRLLPLTSTTSKQLLPVYDRQMIFYPLNTLVKAGIKDILIIVAPKYFNNYVALLGGGEKFGVNISYAIQEKAGGLPEAFILGESFIGNDNVTLILGDNIFEDDFTEAISSFEKGTRIFAKEVSDPERFGVVSFDDNMKAISIEEKPEIPKSAYAVTGLYVYDSRVVEFSKDLVPSKRDELEIVDLHNKYLSLGELDVRITSGIWEDAGTFDSLLRVNILAKEKLSKNLII
ncbi:MAG: sugar phosphate nucleotidyltransferase [Candidatus Nomurabacteria bacterium]|nr:sugar phosphate nucleotidyltransferase [Candidatus Nomurabacteria bacterium]